MISHSGHHHNTKQKEQEKNSVKNPYYHFPTYNSPPHTHTPKIIASPENGCHFCSVYPRTVVAEAVTLAVQGAHEADWLRSKVQLTLEQLRG